MKPEPPMIFIDFCRKIDGFPAQVHGHPSSFHESCRRGHPELQRSRELLGGRGMSRMVFVATHMEFSGNILGRYVEMLYSAAVTSKNVRFPVGSDREPWRAIPPQVMEICCHGKRRAISRGFGAKLPTPAVSQPARHTHTLSPRHSLSLSPSLSLLSLSLLLSLSIYLSISLFPSLPPFPPSLPLSFSFSLSLSPSFSPSLLLSFSPSLLLSFSPSLLLSFSPSLLSHAHTHTHARTHTPAHMGTRVQMTWRCSRNNRTCFLLPMSVFSAQTSITPPRFSVKFCQWAWSLSPSKCPTIFKTPWQQNFLTQASPLLVEKLELKNDVGEARHLAWRTHLRAQAAALLFPQPFWMLSAMLCKVRKQPPSSLQVWGSLYFCWFGVSLQASFPFFFAGSILVFTHPRFEWSQTTAHLCTGGCEHFLVAPNDFECIYIHIMYIYIYIQLSFCSRSFGYFSVLPCLPIEARHEAGFASAAGYEIPEAEVRWCGPLWSAHMWPMLEDQRSWGMEPISTFQDSRNVPHKGQTANAARVVRTWFLLWCMGLSNIIDCLFV